MVLGGLGILLAACHSESPEKVRLRHQKRKIALIAHRGASSVAPENTLSSIKEALQSPADFIEIDIHQTTDGEVVVMHDASVDRTTNGKGEIAELTLAEIKKLDAGSWFDSTYTNEQVPTLEEVLKLVKGRKKLLIEVKKGDNFYLGIEDKTIALIQKYQAQNWCILQSFYDEILQNIWKNEYPVASHKLIIGKIPWLPVYFDHTIRWGSFDKYYRASAINLNQYFASKSIIRHIHTNGFKTYIWTVDKPNAINRLVDWGADGIITNAATTLTIE